MKKFLLIILLFIIFIPKLIYSLTLNNIAAVINDDIITMHEINKSMVEMLEQNPSIPEEQLAKKIIMSLIEDNLLSQITKKYKFELSDEEIKNIVTNRIEDEKESYPNESEFIKYLESQNTNLVDY